MSEEQMQILNMLAEHKITADEAQRLLDALGGPESDVAEAKVEQAMAKLGEAMSRVFSGGTAAEWSEVAEPTVGEPVEGAEEGFEMAPDSTLAVRVKGASVRVTQVDEGRTASVTSSGRRAASVQRKGNTYFVIAGRGTGDVEVTIPPVRSVELKVTGGNVRLDGVRADVDANVKGGNLEARGCAGGFKARLMGGNADIGGRVRSISLKCMGGSATLNDLHIVEGEHSIRNMGGSVSLVVSPEASLTVRTSTFGGRVTSDVPAASESGRGPKHRAEYKFGGGAAVLNVKAFGGDVTISRKEVAGAADNTEHED